MDVLTILIRRAPGAYAFDVVVGEKKKREKSQLPLTEKIKCVHRQSRRAGHWWTPLEAKKPARGVDHALADDGSARRDRRGSLRRSTPTKLAAAVLLRGME